MNDLDRTIARTIAANAGLVPDGHGSYHRRGDHIIAVDVLDYVEYSTAKQSPYWDQGGDGLALVSVTRRRVYAKSSKWWPKSTTSTFLVGRNEVGTYFSHAVPSRVCTVLEAVQWIWSGRAYRIFYRQGDIALVRAAGPKLPAALPASHVVCGDHIEHPTHPDIPLPGVGERIIVARRAVAHATAESRD